MASLSLLSSAGIWLQDRCADLLATAAATDFAVDEFARLAPAAPAPAPRYRWNTAYLNRPAEICRRRPRKPAAEQGVDLGAVLVAEIRDAG